MEKQNNVEEWEDTPGLPDFFSDEEDFTSLTENAIDLQKQYEINPVFRDEVDNMIKTINPDYALEDFTNLPIISTPNPH